MSYFECSNLYKEWDSISIDISFKAEQGTMTAIVGPSGSGKSTVLRIISGLIHCDKRPDALPPSIRFGQKEIMGLPPSKRGIGMVFQGNSLFMHKTVEDNVGYGLRCAGLSKKESRIRAAEMLRSIGLVGFGKRWPETLSGGEAQRVSIARTLITQPSLVLLDEPMSSLDAHLRKKLAEDIHAMQKALGFTAIMVTHDIEEAKSMSSRIITMQNGKKVWEGDSADFKGL